MKLEMGDGDYLACFKYVFLPIAREFNPELVIVSAGFDCGKNDIVGPMKVSTKGTAEPHCVTYVSLGFEQMMAMVLTLANGNVVCALEGGYTLKTTAKGAVGCISVLTVFFCPLLFSLLIRGRRRDRLGMRRRQRRE